MKKTGKRLLVCVLWFFISTRLQAAFEEKYVSARAAGRGGALAAFCDGPEALAANPAGLRYVDGYEIQTSRAQLFGESDLPAETLSGAGRVRGVGSWGASFVQFGPAL